ncbi:MAG TPA: hypothetical protein VJJ98_12385 [Sedimentisphaerales bacterium]|nr:hypothetical protein [Sedimentisphaerales bacterium]
MTSEGMGVSEQEKHDAAVGLLEELKEKLLSSDISTARVAAFRLARMQDDGLAILKEALFGKHPRTTKKAAAYGMRSMNGRMRKMARAVLEEGLKHRDRTTKAACVKAIFLMDGGIPEKNAPRGKHRSRDKGRIREIRGGRRRDIERERTPQG